VTAFPISAATILPNSWKDITGNDPDEVVKQAPPLQSLEAGPFYLGRLSVAHQPGRIDLILMPDTTKLSDGLAHVGVLDLAIENILPAAQKMFRPDMVMQRLAVGAILILPVDSAEDGYELVRSTLPVARDIPENARDLFLQLNIPIGVSVTDHPEISINRLVKWQVVRLRIITGITSGAGPTPTQMVTGPDINAVRVELDISTPPDLPFALSHQNILDLIDHLAAQARAIAANAGWFP
jgi:hypothetical protein